MVEPAARLGRDGFVVNDDLVSYMDRTMAGYNNSFLETDPLWAQDFAPNGTLLKKGDILYRTRYSESVTRSTPPLRPR